MSSTSAQTVQEAWIGDAVLSLYVRLLILQEGGKVDGERSVRMTSNQFLGAFGEPTEIEARIGRVYRDSGLEAAFGWIEDHLVPLFRRQEENRLRRSGSGPDRTPKKR